MTRYLLTMMAPCIRCSLLLSLAAVLTPLSGAVAAESLPELTLHKRPNCNCCEAHAEALRADGFTVTVVARNDLALFREARGVTGRFAGCHTIEAGGYVVEGHVPGTMIHKLLEESPPILGIALPGMPSGTPGMPGPRSAPVYDVLVIDESAQAPVVFDQF